MEGSPKIDPVTQFFLVLESLISYRRRYAVYLTEVRMIFIYFLTLLMDFRSPLIFHLIFDKLFTTPFQVYFGCSFIVVFPIYLGVVFGIIITDFNG